MEREYEMDRELERLFKERDVMTIVNEDRWMQFEENKRRSLEKREFERRIKYKKKMEINRLVAGMLAACAITLGVVHVSNKKARVETSPISQVELTESNIYTNQGRLIYHSDKNWVYDKDGNQNMDTLEVAKDLSLLSEVNRKYALYEITDEMKIGSILVDDYEHQKNVRNIKSVIKELSKLVGKTDTNYLNVEDLTDVFVRYGFRNYNEFAKSCEEEISVLNESMGRGSIK